MTTIGHIDTDPGYRFARLADHMLGAGIVAGWSTNKTTAYKTNLDMPWGIFA
ncbi:hypothetical protein [Paenarthrobacter nitroguajacolicus]|uniref:hypothetical protein n=1 Tax=Paenarthrobacter nitroguajacolicus TaxID=211146 RepID=UPI00142EEDE1|nr:hypothetical protein [Paenarthrobacter nitroguajacolicus]